MKWLALIILFVLTFYTGYFGTRFIYYKNSKSKVLSKTSEISLVGMSPTSTVSQIPTQTPSPSLTSTPTTVPTNTPTPTPTHIPQPVVTSEEIHKLMERFAGQYVVDVNVLRHVAVCESGFNPNASNHGYAGLYQFNKTAWVNNRHLMGEDINTDLRFNAEESVQTAAYLISNGKRSLWPNCYPK